MLRKIVWQTRRAHLEYMVRDGHKLIHETHHEILNIPAKRKTLHMSMFYSCSAFNQASNFSIINTFENVHNSKKGVLFFITPSPWKSQMCAVCSRKATVATTDYFRMPKCWEMPKKKQLLYSHSTSILFYKALQDRPGKAEYPTTILS